MATRRGPLRVRVAHVDFELWVEDEAARLDVERRYAAFRVEDGGPARVLDCRGPRRSLPRVPAERSVLEGSTLTTSLGRSWAHLDRASGRGHITPHPGMKVLDMLVRAEVTLAALEAGGLALHASAVDVGDGGVLFAGASGAGKSTVARQLAAEGGRVVCDDLAVVRPGPGRDDGWWVHGTPFGEGSAPPVRLARSFALRQEALRVDDVTVGESARHLARNLALCVEDAALVRAALAGADALARAVPGGVLSWRLGDSLREPVLAAAHRGGWF